MARRTSVPDATVTVDGTEVEGVLVEGDGVAGSGEAVNAETGEVTQPGQELPEAEPLPENTELVEIVMLGRSLGRGPGENVQVTAQRAATLVAQGHARYPA